MRGAAAYLHILQALLPAGAAWPREPDATLTQLLSALAQELARIDGRAAQLLDEADPRTTSELLDDWERCAGLPDPCMPANQSIAQRRQALVQRLIARGGQSPAYYIELARHLGTEITITEFDLHTVQSDVEHPFCDTPWLYAWQVNAPLDSEVTQLDVNGAATDPLAWWPSDAQLECVIQRFKPAHTKVLFVYEPEWPLDIDFTAQNIDSRIYYRRTGPQTYVDENGVLQVAANDVWPVDHDPVTHEPLGRTVWGEQTNYVRNSTMQGASAGVPGSDPTYWNNAGSASGLTRNVTEVGIEDGMAYVEYHVTGTPTNITYGHYFDAQLPVAHGEEWAIRFLVKVVGTPINVAGVQLLLQGRDASNNIVSQNGLFVITPTPGELTPAYVSHTMDGEAIVRGYAGYSIRFAQTGQPAEVTYRIYCPMAVKGQRVGPFIPTSGTAVTRGAPTISIAGSDLASWFDARKGTFVVEAGTYSQDNATLLIAHNPAATEYLRLVKFANQNSVNFRVSSGGAVVASPARSGVPTDGTLFRIAAAYGDGSYAIALNGSPVSRSSGAVPVDLLRLRLGDWAGGGQPLNGRFKRVRWSPKVKNDAELQQLSAP